MKAGQILGLLVLAVMMLFVMACRNPVGGDPINGGNGGGEVDLNRVLLSTGFEQSEGWVLEDVGEVYQYNQWQNQGKTFTITGSDGEERDFVIGFNPVFSSTIEPFSEANPRTYDYVIVNDDLAGTSFAAEGDQAFRFRNAGTYLQLPPVDQPGTVRFTAKRNNDNVTGMFRLQRLVGETWVQVSEFPWPTNTVSGAEFITFDAFVGIPEDDVVLRLLVFDSSHLHGANGNITIDNLKVYSGLPQRWGAESGNKLSADGILAFTAFEGELIAPLATDGDFAPDGRFPLSGQVASLTAVNLGEGVVGKFLATAGNGDIFIQTADGGVSNNFDGTASYALSFWSKFTGDPAGGVYIQVYNETNQTPGISDVPGLLVNAHLVHPEARNGIWTYHTRTGITLEAATSIFLRFGGTSPAEGVYFYGISLKEE